MKKPIALETRFVEAIPERLEDRTLYVSIEYATAAHKCCCGCGLEVVTPLSPTDWKLTYDGMSVSLHPSIGNWGFKCRSHYWIDKNTVRWAEHWPDVQIDAGRTQDLRSKEAYFGETGQLPISADLIATSMASRKIRSRSLLGRLWTWLWS